MARRTAGTLLFAPSSRRLAQLRLINIPLKTLDAESTAALDRATAIVVYCWDGEGRLLGIVHRRDLEDRAA